MKKRLMQLFTVMGVHPLPLFLCNFELPSFTNLDVVQAVMPLQRLQFTAGIRDIYIQAKPKNYEDLFSLILTNAKRLFLVGPWLKQAVTGKPYNSNYLFNISCKPPYCLTEIPHRTIIYIDQADAHKRNKITGLHEKEGDAKSVLSFTCCKLLSLELFAVSLEFFCKNNFLGGASGP